MKIAIENTKPAEIALIGCGAVSETLYTPVLQALETERMARVAALVDPGKAQRTTLEKFFPGARSFADMSECDLTAFDLVIIASPPKFHAEQTILALQKSVPVLCEKPMAQDSAQARQMLEASHQTKTPLAVGHFRRFFPASKMLKSVFEKKPFGELLNFSVQEGGKFAWGVASAALFSRDHTPGGVLYDSGIHVIDLLLWWLGKPEDFTYEDDAMGGLEANCLLEMTYPRGVTGTVRLSRDWSTQNRYLFSFERGTLLFEVGQANKLSLLIDGLPYVLGGELMKANSTDGTIRVSTQTVLQSFGEQVRNVLRGIRNEEPLMVPGDEAIHSLQFIEECYSRRRFMDMPWLADDERCTAQKLARDLN
jgi:predicted dehydrogenase